MKCFCTINSIVLGVSLAKASALSKQVVLQDAVDSAKAVFPADFFAFFVGAPVVGNAHLINAAARLGDFGGNFWLKAKAVFLNADRLDDFAAKGFVAGFHVAKVNIGHHVRQQRQELVAHHVPKVDHAVGSAAHKARAKYHIGFALQDWLNQNGKLLRVVF